LEGVIISFNTRPFNGKIRNILLYFSNYYSLIHSPGRGADIGSVVPSRLKSQILDLSTSLTLIPPSSNNSPNFNRKTVYYRTPGSGCFWHLFYSLSDLHRRISSQFRMAHSLVYMMIIRSIEAVTGNWSYPVPRADNSPSTFL
jgi:hypothetical protein